MGHICVDLPNTNNKWVGFGLANVDTFIIHVEFGLADVDMFCTLTRPIDTNCHPYRNMSTSFSVKIIYIYI